jgi:Zn finger protein HypA/HybF involved in hydrogenase expression
MGEDNELIPEDNELIPQAVLQLSNQVRCPICKTIFRDSILGMNKCPKCGYEELNDFGKIRTYLEKFGSSPAHVIAEATGVSIKVIDKYLIEGRLEIPEGSPVYIKCQSCGTDLRYGRFCSECALKMCKQLQVMFNQVDVGEQPKKKPVSSKMKFLDRDRKL